ncbi:hypothetical protein [Legionella sp. km772]|uniref:hypothetical protein n=1 Tax=Legionella sp. km772 TaxID=2498111 RepID=UPI000F8CB64E|nr:hypothetical protein [Legionella sp. km772]RUR10992.1 hypothetical protein ELY15_07495 [Legionella sp. km772]
MTFELKGYNELKAHFAETVEIIKKKYSTEAIKIESLEQLTEPRRSQLKFIEYTIESLDTRLDATKPINKPRVLEEATRTLNGAMLLVSTQITENLGPIQRNSLLRDRLNLGMGITAEHAPSHFDLTKCYEELNKFFKLVFVERNSRKGLKAEHDLQYIPLDTLVALMKRSYELEELSNKNALAEYAPGGKAAILAKNFKTEAVPAAVTATFTDWDTIQEALQQLMTDELGDKNVAEINLLSKERAAQFNFLMTIVKNLNALSVESGRKIAILAGAMCIVREQIGQREYSKPALSHDDIPGSLVHTGLTRILKAKETSPENIEVLLRAANDYIMFMTTEPKKLKEKHIFSDIKDFSLVGILELIQSTITVCRKTALDREVAAYKRLAAEKAEAERLAKEETDSATKPTASTGGLAGLLGAMIWGTPKPKSVEKTKVEAEKEKAAVSPH